MPDYADPTGRGRAAIVALVAYIAAELAQAAVVLVGGGPHTAGVAALALVAALLAAVIGTGRWTYRVNANAHRFATGLTITPGWAVGWYFVPFANLFKPFEAMKETWAASTPGEDWGAAPVPALLRVWWGFWLVGNILSNPTLRRVTADDASLVATLDLVSSGLLVVAGAALIRMIVLLDRLQVRMHAAAVFA